MSQPSERQQDQGVRNLTITGDVINSPVVVGDNNIVINGDRNVVIDKLSEALRPNVSRLPAQIIGRPSHPIYLLDRSNERQAIQGALTSGTSVEFYSAPGFGKTTLLRHTALEAGLQDGMVFLSVNGYALEDIFQELFETFYQSDRKFIPSQVQRKRYFSSIRALILLDDLEISREDLQVLLDTLPNSVFIIASSQSRLLGQGNVISLQGLPYNDARVLFEKYLGRRLRAEEEPFVQQMLTALEGNPLRVMQQAQDIRTSRRSIKEAAGRLRGPSLDANMVANIVSGLNETEQRTLALLAALDGAALPAEHLKSLLKTQNLGPLLGNLLGSGLIKAHSPRYSLAGTVNNSLQSMWNLSQWQETLLSYFVKWATGRMKTREQVMDVADALFKVLEYGSQSGRWQDILQIGYAVEPAFILLGAWGYWTRLLTFLSQASQALGNHFMQAWALHQMGSHALGLGNLGQARQYLSQALKIRKSIGDQAGISATQHNLNLVGGGAAPPRKPPRTGGGSTSGIGWLIPVIGTVIIGTIILLNNDVIVPTPIPPTSTRPAPTRPTPTRPSPTKPVFTFTSTRTPSKTPTRTRTKTPTQTPSNTPTHTPSVTPRPISIAFWSDDDTVLSGDCTYLRWDVINARRVYLDGSEVDGSGIESVCPTNTTTYTLFVEGDEGSEQRKVTVNAVAPYPPSGHSPSLGCYPWSYSDGVTYYDPTMACSRRVDFCYQAGSGCGKAAADAWCDLYTPYREASSWVKGSPQFTTRYVGTGINCYGSSCESFSSITCDYR